MRDLSKGDYLVVTKEENPFNGCIFKVTDKDLKLYTVENNEIKGVLQYSSVTDFTNFCREATLEEVIYAKLKGLVC